jgi:nitroimidazol reductase NimA-like FMN-containing flavoprotein (pyridoxamine 5'-phosphate oxidase superfamily)
VDSEQIQGRLTDIPRLRRILQRLLATQNFGVLCTQSGGQPYGTVVCFAASDDLARLWFATTRSTRKFTHIAADDRVAFVVENTANLQSDVFEAVAATGSGRARELTSAERAFAQERYLAKHQQLEEFVSAPNCALMEIGFETFQVVTRFQEVVEIRVG